MKGVYIMGMIKRLWKDEEGQGLVEYGLLIVLVVVIVIAALAIFGGTLNGLFEDMNTTIDNAF